MGIICVMFSGVLPTPHFLPPPTARAKFPSGISLLLLMNLSRDRMVLRSLDAPVLLTFCGGRVMGAVLESHREGRPLYWGFQRKSPDPGLKRKAGCFIDLHLGGSLISKEFSRFFLEYAYVFLCVH